MTELEKEWNGFVEELSNLMEIIPAAGTPPRPADAREVGRIKDCTLLEEWRMACGYNPFDAEMDHDLWKESYNVLDDENEMDFYHQFATRAGLDDGIIKLKYPRVAAAMKIK